MTTTDLTISVIIPMYNSAATIERALKSVKEQNGFNNFEIIVVNDGSKDNGRDIVEDYIINNQDQRIILVNKENGGVSSARNEGMKNSTGELIAFLDSDDQWLPNKTERQHKIMQDNNEIDFLAAVLHPPALNNIGKVEVIHLGNLIFKNYFQPSTVMMKRNVYLSTGLFKESQRFAEEGNYFMRVANKFRCALLHEKLIVYGDGKSGFGESGLSANLLEMQKGELTNLKFAFDNNYIGFFKYTIATAYSLAKYLRRILIVKLRRI